MSRPILCFITAVALAGVILGIVVGAGGAEDEPVHSARFQALRVGQVCTVNFDFGTEISCDNAGLGDVRFNCSAVTRGRCPEVEAVTLLNVGTETVTIESVSGTGPGEQNVTLSPGLRPGSRTVVSPASGDRYLLDIVMHSIGGGTAAVRVVDIS